MGLCSKGVGAALPCAYAALLCASPWPSLLGSLEQELGSLGALGEGTM